MGDAEGYVGICSECASKIAARPAKLAKLGSPEPMSMRLIFTARRAGRAAVMQTSRGRLANLPVVLFFPPSI